MKQEIITKQSVINRLNEALIQLRPMRNRLYELPEGSSTLDMVMTSMEMTINLLEKVIVETTNNEGWDGVNHWLI